MAVVAEPSAKAGAVTGQTATPSTSPSDPKRPYEFFGRVTYGEATEATMVRDTLAVDPELRPEQVTRALTVEGHDLLIKFNASDVRSLRAAVSTFCDLLALVSRTLETFAPGSEFS